jgi:hypothetical protein
MNDSEFSSRQLTARIEKHLDAEDAIAYLSRLEGREQIVRIAEGPSMVRAGAAGPSPEELEQPKLVVKDRGVVGPLARHGSEEAAPGSGFLTLSVGPSIEIEVALSSLRATRLSMGPEVSALILNLETIHVLLQDVLTEIPIPGST